MSELMSKQIWTVSLAAITAVFLVFVAPVFFQLVDAPMVHPMGDCATADCTPAPMNAPFCLVHCITAAQADQAALSALPSVLAVFFLLSIVAFLLFVAADRHRRPEASPPFHRGLGFATVILRE